MNDYRWIVARLRGNIETFQKYGGDKAAVLARNSANVIEYLVYQRDKAAKRLCECCGVCPEDKRDPWDCEIAMIGPEWDSVSPDNATCKPTVEAAPAHWTEDGGQDDV